MLVLSGSAQQFMPRNPRSKPSNVVKSRSAPSLLGGFGAPKVRDHLPSNRFIELGDIALGNSRRREVHGAVNVGVPEPEVVADLVETPEVEEEVRVPPKPSRLSLPKLRAPKPPKHVASAPLTRPKLPKPPAARPQPPLPPQKRLPKPPKIERPKPFARGPNTPTRRSK
jgi:hypothetical protein